PAEALARLAARGFDRAVVLPLMVIPGEEFHALAQVCGRFQGMAKGLSRIVLADPLLASSADAERLAAILAATPRDDDEALVLMGHGSPHGADLCYPALQYFFSKTNSSILVGTVEGTPSLDDVLAELRARKTAKAVLRPLMTVAGDHARNDMAGPEEDSWVSVLSQAGIACRPLLQGLGSDPKVVALWVEHLKRAMKSLEF
ncbi:MAG: sirohydrochlorin cobaltochelatase, partial [Deltaproteobacteria bacterium]|nr:sirohydrochlorin cobaltochelatase [Deltaproteobacteria bacterium]